MAASSIPTVDLSSFLGENDEDGRRKATQVIGEACSQYGFFQILNHGVPMDLMDKALELSHAFFNYSDEDKRRSSPDFSAPLPAGYARQPELSRDKNEYLLMFPPGSSFNVYPPNPPEFKEVLEEVFSYLRKTGLLIESILNDCLGLPPNFLREFNHDRSWDFMTALHYFPATETENNGVSEHEDGNCITFVFQDEAGGLEVCKDGKWILVPPIKGNIVVNVGDVIQVLTNNRFKSARHRVVRPKEKSRYSFAFFYNLHGDKWVEPLPVFTKDVAEVPKYRGFVFKEYQALRMRNKTHPPSRPEDVIHITYYAINS